MKQIKKWHYVLAAAILAALLFFLFRSGTLSDPGLRQQLQDMGIRKPNIIMITLDTTRADHLPGYGNKVVKTPFLDTIAREGVLFEQCITPTGLTLPSHSSMMTGLYPTYHGVRVNGNAALGNTHQTLAELFSGNGYKTSAFVAAFVLDGRWGLKQGFQHYDDKFDLKKFKRLDLGHVQRPANEVIDSALAWLDTNKKGPFFSWVHLYDPHTPYEPPEPYRSLYNNGELSGLYNGEIAFTDTQIGRILYWLEQNDLDKNTIVVVMGDHGEGLGDHGELTHGYYIYDYTVHVPFMMKTPLQAIKGTRVASQVSTIDLYPTLLEMAGIAVPNEQQGASLSSLMAGKEREKPEEFFAYSESLTPSIQYNWSPLHSIRNGKYKYIDAPKPELYDLQKDPKELNNLVRRFPGKVKKFKKVLDELIDTTSTGAPEPEEANLDQETMKRLATLGYLGGSVTKKRGRKGKILADPKDKFEIFSDIALAGEYIAREKFTEAVQKLEKVLADDNTIPQAKILLATGYVESKQPGKAKTLLDSILKEDADNLQALICMANILFDENKGDDVITLCKKAIAVDNRNTQAHTLIGEVYIQKNDHENAHPYMQKAVDIQPKLDRNRLNLSICLIGLKQYEEAEKQLLLILKESPKFPLVNFHLGLQHEERGNAEEARKFYEEEIKFYDDSFPARFNLGKLLLKFGDKEGYIAEMEKVVKFAPKMAKGYLFLARGLMMDAADAAQYDRILELVLKGIDIARTDRIKAFGYFLMADLYNRKKQPQKLKEALQKANYYKDRSN